MQTLDSKRMEILCSIIYDFEVVVQISLFV